MADPVDEFFATYPANVLAVSRILRNMVQRAISEAIERLFESQDHVSYLFTDSVRDAIVYICPLQDYVRLGFYYGGYLPDPDGVLVGTGQRLRHVKVRSPEEAGDPRLERLVEAAWTEATGRMQKS